MNATIPRIGYCDAHGSTMFTSRGECTHCLAVMARQRRATDIAEASSTGGSLET